MQLGFLALFAGIVVLVAALDAGAGPEIVTWPMLLAGLGVGALASQLGSVAVSSVPDSQSGEVGGLQNTVTNLGASIGTALAGALLIATLTTSLATGIKANPAVPAEAKSKATVQLSEGVSFVSDADLKTALGKAGVPPDVADAIVHENETARIAGLRSSLSALAAIALLAVFLSFRIPTQQPARETQASPQACQADRPCGSAVTRVRRLRACENVTRALGVLVPSLSVTARMASISERVGRRGRSGSRRARAAGCSSGCARSGGARGGRPMLPVRNWSTFGSFRNELPRRAASA